MRMILGVGTGLLMYLIALCLMIPVFSMMDGPPDIIAKLTIASAVAIAAVPYFRYVFPHCTCQVKSGRALIVANKYVPESAKKRRKYSGYREIRAQKEFQAGFHWIYFWEEPFLDVDMSRQIPVEHDIESVYTLKGGKKLIRIKWRVFCTPLVGDIVNFARTREEDIIRRVKDRVESFLQGEVGSMSHIGFDSKQKEQLNKKFENVFLGPDHIDK